MKPTSLRTLFFALLITSCSLWGEAQNLVLNPGFETLAPTQKGYKLCQFNNNNKAFDKKVVNWNTFSGLTPDLIIRPDTLSACIYPSPHGGQNMVGMIIYHPKEDTGYDYDYHEIIQGKLKNPLKVGTTYTISFWIYFDTTIGVEHLTSVYGRKTPIYPVASNNLGFLFTTLPFGSNEYIRNSIEQFDLKPQVVFEDVMLTTKGKWQKMSVTFLAKRNYKYFLMGNFSSDFRTNVKPDDFEEKMAKAKKANANFYATPKRIAYYCFDDIDIRPYNGINEALAKDKVYTFKNLNFESGKAALRKEALNELLDLSKWLIENKDKKVEIGGHTDSVGKVENNQILSQKRAAAVYNYLLAQGINKDRLSYKGYGASQAKTTNKTAKGRKVNRRVECKLVD